jgi:hypothetical protein
MHARIRGLAVLAVPALAVAALLASAAGASAATGVTAVTHSPQHDDTTNVSGPATGTSPNGPTWAVDNLTEQFSVVPVTGQSDGANYQVTITVTGSFKGFADPTTGGFLTSTGPVKGTIEYDVFSSTPPDPASLLPNQAPDTGLGAALSQLFDGNSTIVGGGAYNFSYQNGNYVQTTSGITGDVTGH